MTALQMTMYTMVLVPFIRHWPLYHHGMYSVAQRAPVFWHTYHGSTCIPPSPRGVKVEPMVCKTIDEEDRGIIRTISSGGWMTTGEIAGWNENAKRICTYRMAVENGIDHPIWDCPFFKKIGIEQDPLLASIPSKCLLTCVKRGIAFAMRLDGNKTSWGKT